MKAYSEYWAMTMTRGLTLILSGTVLLVAPELISSIPLLPFGVVIALDSVLVFGSGFSVPLHRPGRLASRISGVFGTIFGVLLFSIVCHQANLRWFAYIFALQASAIAIIEVSVAMGTSDEHEAKWCYAASIVGALCAVALLIARELELSRLAWVLCAYLIALGSTFIAVSARVLFYGHAVSRSSILQPYVLLEEAAS